MDYSSYYGYSDYYDAADVAAVGGALAGLAVIGIIAWIIGMAVIVVSIIAQWKIFKKAGEEGWKAIIPVYNIITLFKIVGINPLLVLVFLAGIIPFVRYLVILGMTIYSMIKLAQAFGKSGGFIAGLILLSPIFMCILAFGDSQYIGTPYASNNTPTSPPPPPPQA